MVMDGVSVVISLPGPIGFTDDCSDVRYCDASQDSQLLDLGCLQATGDDAASSFHEGQDPVYWHVLTVPRLGRHNIFGSGEAHCQLCCSDCGWVCSLL